MKVLLCTGSPHSGCEQVFELLVQAGVAMAQPVSCGAMTPQLLQAQLLGSLEVDLHNPLPLKQVKPGQLWAQLAADLFLTNISSAVWGWADHQTTVLMDFWQDFDPQVRLVLVYSTPQDYLVQLLDHDLPPTQQTVAYALDQWMRWSTALLRYYYRHPSRCVLVDSQQALEQPQSLLDALTTQWQLTGLSASAASQAPAYGQLQFHLVNELIDPQHAALSLSQELDGAALVPSSARTNGKGDATPNAAWSDWVGMRAQLAELAQSNSKLIASVADSTRAMAELEAQLAERPQAAQVAAQLADREHETELILLQLHRVQEELEHYYMLHQKLQRQQQQRSETHGFVTDFWRTHQPVELCVDLRRGVVGSNWYHEEDDGCWAGPALVSSVQMPPLQAGNYTLVLEVVDAMSPGIVQNMVFEALGQSDHFEVESLTPDADYPLVCKAQLSIAPDTPPEPWHISLRFTHVVSPATTGVDDHRHLAIRLQTLRLLKSI